MLKVHLVLSIISNKAIYVAFILKDVIIKLIKKLGSEGNFFKDNQRNLRDE